jgi:hypothetical protein
MAGWHIILISFKSSLETLILNRQIWLGLGVSIICVIAVLNLMQRLLSYLPENGENLSQPNSPNDNPPTGKSLKKNRVTKGETGKQYLYVFGNLLSQGFTFISNYSLPLSAGRSYF